MVLFGAGEVALGTVGLTAEESGAEAAVLALGELALAEVLATEETGLERAA